MSADTTAQRDLLTVIIPCLNEEDAVAGTVDDVLRTARELPVDVEIMLVDDGSTDGTVARMEALCAAHPACGMHVNGRNLGVGRTVLNAYPRIKPNSWVTVLPGDNELVFASIKNHLAVCDQYDLVLGYLSNSVIRPTIRRVASSAFTVTANSLYGWNFRYLNGMKLYRRETFLGLEIEGGGHGLNPELIAKALLRNPDLRIGEVPFTSRGRAHGSTKAFSAGSIWRAVRDTAAGYRAVNAFRDRMIAESAEALEAERRRVNEQLDS